MLGSGFLAGVLACAALQMPSAVGPGLDPGNEQARFESALAARDAGALRRWFDDCPSRAFLRPIQTARAQLAQEAADDGTLRFLAAALGERAPGALLARLADWTAAERARYRELAARLASLAEDPAALDPAELAALHAELHALGCEPLLFGPLGRCAGRLLDSGEAEAARALTAHLSEVAQGLEAHWTASWAEEWLGRYHWRTGELPLAAEHLERAVEQERRLGGGAYEVRLLVDLASVELGAGRIERGMRAADEALALAVRLGDPELVRAARAAQASLHLDLGELQTALGICLELRGDGAERAADVAGIRLDLLAANVLSDVGRLEAAIAFAERALTASSAPSIDPAQGEPLGLEARLTLGLYLGDAGRVEEGLALLAQARAAFAERGDRRGVGWAEKNRGWVLCDAGRCDEALAAFAAGRRAGAELDVPFLEAWCALGAAETWLAREEAGGGALDPDAFEQALAAARERGAALVDRHLEWRIAAAQGRFEQRAGRLAEAYRSYREAVAQIERWRRRLDAPGLLVHFLRQKSDPYRRAAFAAAALGDADGALRYAELLRARVTSELRAGGGPGGGLTGPDPRLHALRLEVSRVETALRGGELEPALRARLAGELEALEDELDLALMGAELCSAEAPRGEAAAPAGRPAGGLDALCARVAASDLDVLVAYLCGERETLAFVARAEGARLERLPVGERQLAEWVARLRAPIEALGAGELDLANLGFDLRASRALTGALVAPLGLRERESVGFVTDGPLTALPFEALVVGGAAGPVQLERPFAALASLTFLGDGHALSYLTLSDPGPPWSAPAPGAALVACVAPAAVGVGSAARELAALRAAGGAFALATVERAGPEDVLAAAPGAFGLHLIAHGVADPRHPAQSHLILGAGADAEPGAEPGAARLEAWRIEALDLARTGLVVLSACHTAEGSWYSGEGLVDLARSFRIAGARRVVASRWAVDDRATAVLMELFYAALARGAAPAEALRTARVALRERDDPRGIALAHPYFFAAWAVER